MRKYLIVCVLLDLLWAGITATMVAMTSDVAIKATESDAPYLPVFVWIYTFLIALIQGAIFLFVISIFGRVIIGFARPRTRHDSRNRRQ